MSKKSKGTPSPAARLRAKIRQAERTLARHQAVLDAGTEDGNGYLLNLRKDNAANARRKIARLSETLAAMEAADAPAPAPDAPAYHAFRELHGRPIAEMCGLSGNVVPRGTRIPSAIEQTYNFPQLLSTGAIRRGPPPVSRPRVPAPPAIVAKPVQQPDHIQNLAAAISKIMDTGRDFSAALDLVDSGLWKRASVQLAEQPRMVAGAGWGSGGALVRSGIGSNRRIADDLDVIVRDRVMALRSAAPGGATPSTEATHGAHPA